MDHLYTKTTGKSPAPSETKLFCVNIYKATYGLGNSVYDVSSTLRIMVSEQGALLLGSFFFFFVLRRTKLTVMMKAGRVCEPSGTRSSRTDA